jgi:hypothetical protein
MVGSRALRALVTPGSPLPLALLRVAVCLIILVSPEPGRAQALAEGPSELWLAPSGMRWFLPVFEALSPHLWLARRLLQASALLALFGLWTRASLSLLALTFLLVFGGAQLSGAVLHDMHLLWFVLLLLVTPSAQVLSLDAWARGSPLWSGSHSSAAAVGSTFVRLLLGLVYFFPGLHKLLDGGLGWASSGNLQHQLWLKWFQAGGVLPWPRVDLWPGLLQAGGIAVLVFELSFVWLACSRRGRQRAVAALMGLSFHALTQHFMYIAFPSLWACYVVLLAGPRAPTVHRERVAPVVTPWPALLVGLSLALGVSLQGARGQTQSWPFACYPSFSAPAPDTIADLAVEVRAMDGQQRTLRIGPLPPFGGRPPHAWSTVWGLAGVYGTAASAARLESFGDALLRREGRPGEHARVERFYVEAYATAPEAYGKPPLSRVPIHSVGR